MKMPDPIINIRASLKHLALILAAAAVAAFAADSAQAATLTWALGGGGDWDITTENWTGDATLFVSDGTQDVIFSNTAGGAITVAATSS